ncbi:MAG: DapH/DapD/GlmU-related protein [Promethearchaeota archaeon]
MSVPNTMRLGPFTPTVLAKKRYLIFYFLLIWASIIPLLLEFWVYWQLLWSYRRPVHFYTYLPLLAFLMYVTIVFAAIFFTKILLVIINAIHKPREGIFLRIPEDRDYRYWSLRNTIKRWPTWLAHRFPFPGILDNICFKTFGVKTKISNSLFEGWVDTEMIEFGRDVVIGQGAIVQSAVIVGNLLIIKKTKIEDGVRIGSHSIVMPGTHIKHNCILAANSVTTVGQVLEKNWIYIGIPAKKFKKNYFFEDGLEDKLGQVEDVEALRERYEEIYTKRYDELKYKERKELKKEKKEEEKKRFDFEEYDVFDDGFNI